MADQDPVISFSSQLLAQDASNTDPQYREYRDQLAHALNRARRKERIAYWICAVTAPISVALMFVGGSGVLGSFDPWSREATPLSITLAAIYVISSVVFWILLASFYSRFRPRTRAAENGVRDALLLQLASKLESLQKEVAALKNERPSSDTIREPNH